MQVFSYTILTGVIETFSISQESFERENKKGSETYARNSVEERF